MSLFGNNWLSLLEFQEGKREYLWHYNSGDNVPETFGWRGLLWYNRKNKKAAELIDSFCDSIDKAFPKRNATFKQVKTLADFFVKNLSDEMKNYIIPFDPKKYHRR